KSNPSLYKTNRNTNRNSYNRKSVWNNITIKNIKGEIQVDQIQHQMMGYDRAITMFSTLGRLLQLEYAKRTVRPGNTALGMVCKDGIILVTDKRIVDKLVVPETIEKIFKIDDHLMCTAAGILSDARVLVERAQLKAQQHRIDYDNPIDTIAIVKD